MIHSTGHDNVRDPEEAWRIKGAGRLTRRQLAYLRELWRWRDAHARRGNVPAFKILGNEYLFDVVRWAESHPGAPLGEGPKLPRNIVGLLLSTLQEAIKRAAAMPRTQWPEVRRYERDETPRIDNQELIDALRGECARIAKELEIAASTLAPRAALEAIARTRPRTVDQIMTSSALLRWQAELMHGPVEKHLHSAKIST
jgi:ribonuclease D